MSTPSSRDTVQRTVPVGGFTEADPLVAGPSSIVSGQNVWVRPGVLQSRWGLTRIDSNVLDDVPVGAFRYHDTDGATIGMVASKATVAYLNGSSYQSLVYASGVSNEPLTGAASDDIFGESIYLPRTDTNLAVFTNGVNPLYAWGGPSDNTAYSTLTQSPIATDLTIFNNRIVAWNVRTDAVSGRRVTGALWSVAGDPEDWTGIGSGSEDLVDMTGSGTRIFTVGDEMILATEEEIWRGRAAAFPTIHAFSPLSQQQGIPYKRAAINTPRGIFWLGRDYNIYGLGANRQITPIGDAIQHTLRNTLKRPEQAFFGYNEELQRLTFYYTADTDTYAQRAFDLDFVQQVWTPQRFTHELARAGTVAVPSSTVSTWNQLAGTIAANTQTWDELAGVDGTQEALVLTSQGTVLYYDKSATSDDGSTVASQARFGALFAGDPFRLKFTKQIRLDARADRASDLTVSISGDLGGSLDNQQAVSMSVQSNTTQNTLWLGVSGLYPQLGLESEDLGWQVTAYAVTARLTGEAL